MFHESTKQHNKFQEKDMQLLSFNNLIESTTKKHHAEHVRVETWNWKLNFGSHFAANDDAKQTYP